MLTRNGKAICKFNAAADRTNNGTIAFINTVNTETTRSSGASSNQTSLNYFMSSLYMSAGTGSDSPSSTDYALTDEDAGLTVIHRTRESSNGSYRQDYIAIFSVSYRNDTENDITVSEVGVLGTGNDKILLAREVIDPVTIAPGEAYTFTMYIG